MTSAVPPLVFAGFVLTVIVVAFAVHVVSERPRWRGEAELRREIRARPVVTFWAWVDVEVSASGTRRRLRGRLDLTVRGDTVEVSSSFPPARFLLGQVYCYRAADMTIRAGPAGWIEIGGRSDTRIWIRRRKQNRQIWQALIDAGARPIGSAPLLDGPGEAR